MLAESKRGYDKRREKLLSELRSISSETILKNLKLSGGKVSEKILLNSFSTILIKNLDKCFLCDIRIDANANFNFALIFKRKP